MSCEESRPGILAVALPEAENGSPATVGTRVVELLEAAYRSAEQGGAPINVADLLAAPSSA